jgi:uncharacterized protein YbbC (DUF1343 family)
MLLGVDNLINNRYRTLCGLKIALCTNYPVCDSKLTPTLEIFKNQKKIQLQSIFAPEHGLYGDLQDQINSSDSLRSGIPIISLYGRNLTPPAEAIKSVDAIVVDLIDIGCRYYTFLWSAMLMLQAAAKFGKKVVILDRPNPLGGKEVQGPLLESEFASFVGLFPIPIRHGMTIGELSRLINEEFGIRGRLEIVPLKGWKRSMYFHETGLPWTIPSPNMPAAGKGYLFSGLCIVFVS